MAKYAPVALVAALLVATALAFVYTEKLKLTLSPILGTRVDKVFAPTCDCPTGSAVIFFRLRKSDRLTVEIVDRGGTAVRTLVRNDPTPRGRTTFRWDGRDDAGRVVPEGNYRPRVHLSKERRTIVLPNPIRVDVTPPQVQLESLGPRVFSPDGDGRRERVIARYRVDEPARVALFVDGVRRALKRGQKDAGRIDWYGRVDGEPLPAGTYRISLGARDVAGNVGPRTSAKSVLIRYVALGRDRVRTAAGGRFAILVLSDAAKVRWRLGERSGLATPGTLRLTAPAEPGLYTLVVSANGFVDRAAVVVRAPKP